MNYISCEGALNLAKYVMLETQAQSFHTAESHLNMQVKKGTSGFQRATWICIRIQIHDKTWCATLCTLHCVTSCMSYAMA